MVCHFFFLCHFGIRHSTDFPIFRKALGLKHDTWGLKRYIKIDGDFVWWLGHRALVEGGSLKWLSNQMANLGFYMKSAPSFE